MASIINIALSGLSSSGRQIEAIASNIANIRYEPQPQTASRTPVDSAQNTESANNPSSIKAISPTSTPVYDSTAADLATNEGLATQSANADYAEQAVNLILARNSYKASVSTIQATNSVMASVLDIVE